MVELPDFIVIPSALLKDRTLTPLDRVVYGVVYWFARLKNEKCILSNPSIGELTFSTAGAVANSLSRLNNRGYVRVVLDKRTNDRLEIIPLVVYSTPSSNNEPPLHQRMNPPSLSNEQNNRNIKRKKESTANSEKKAIAESDYRPTESHSKLEPLSLVKLWEIAMKKNVPLSAVRETHKRILEDIEGENRYKIKDVNLALQKWISMGISRGNIREMNEIERMDLESDHPDRIAKRQALMKLAVEQKLI